MTNEIRECVVCGSGEVTESRVTRTTRLYGLEEVVFKNLPVEKCASCGDETISIPNHKAVMNVVRERLCALKRVVSGREFAFLRDGLSLTGQQAAKVLGVTNVSISRWENGAQPVSPWADHFLRALTLHALGKQELVKRLETVEEQGVDRVEVDLADYNGTHYRYQTGYQFGKNQQSAWIVRNVCHQR